MCRIIFSDKNNWLIRQARRQGGWGVRSVRSHPPPPRAKKVRLEVTCSAENVNLWKKNVKDDLSLYPVFVLLIYLPRRTDYERIGSSIQTVQWRSAPTRIFDNPSLTIFRTPTVLFHNICDFSHTNNTAVRKSAVFISTRLHPLLNNCVLFALVKLAFVALLSGNILWFGSSVSFTFRAVNNIMQKGCGHLLASMTPKHWKLMCLFADTITSEYSTLYWLILWAFFDTF